MLSNILWWPWAQIGGGAPPVTPEYNPIGGPLPGDRAELPARRGRRRRTQDIITDEEEALTIILMYLDE